jgi:hypothetical protein
MQAVSTTVRFARNAFRAYVLAASTGVNVSHPRARTSHQIGSASRRYDDAERYALAYAHDHALAFEPMRGQRDQTLAMAIAD